MMKIKRGKGVAQKVIPLIILLLLIAGGVMVVKKKKAELVSVPLPEKAVTAVVVTDAPWGTFAAHENFLGTVMPKIHTDLSPRLTAHIVEVRVREGAQVRKGELLALLDDREQRDTVAALEAQLASARSALATEEAIFRRDRTLFDAKAISREALELSTSRRDAERAQVATLRKQLDSARTILSYTRLDAPFDGVITERIMEPGDLAVPGKPVLAMEAPDEGYYVRVHVPQEEIPLLKCGDVVTLYPDLSGDGSPAAAPEPVNITISRLHPAVRNGTLCVIEADIAARPFGLPSGATVKAAVRTGRFTGLKVPLRSLLEQVRSAVIFTVKGDTVQPVHVTVLYRGTDWAVVKAPGLGENGTAVITAQESALLRLHEGQKIRPVRDVDAEAA